MATAKHGIVGAFNGIQQGVLRRRPLREIGRYLKRVAERKVRKVRNKIFLIENR